MRLKFQQSRRIKLLGEAEYEVGRVLVGDGIARAHGLDEVQAGESRI